MSQRQWRRKGRELRLKKIRIKCDSGGEVSQIRLQRMFIGGLKKKRNMKLAYLRC